MKRPTPSAEIEKPRDSLSSDDRIVWESVARTVQPLHARQDISANLEDMEKVFAAIAGETVQQASVVRTVDKTAKEPAQPKSLNPIDRRTHRKISKGHLSIDGRIDLHGLTQHEAYSLLQNFIEMAQFRGYRHILIITGKGRSSGSDGVLRQIVPHWLATAPFRLYVSAIEDAARHHGGGGALYVKLRRNSGGDRL